MWKTSPLLIWRRANTPRPPSSEGRISNAGSFFDDTSLSRGDLIDVTFVLARLGFGHSQFLCAEDIGATRISIGSFGIKKA